MRKLSLFEKKKTASRLSKKLFKSRLMKRTERRRRKRCRFGSLRSERSREFRMKQERWQLLNKM